MRPTVAQTQEFDSWLLDTFEWLRSPTFQQQGHFQLARILWGIWKTRNECLVEGKTPDAVQTLNRILSTDPPPQNSGTLGHVGVIPTRNLNPGIVEPNFRSPASGIKVNTDATFSLDSKRGAIGLIFKDGRGVTLFTHSRSIIASSALAVEALAIREVLLVSTNFQLHEVRVESDCQALISQIKSNRFDWAIAPILKDIQELKIAIPRCTFVWIKREFNTQAHNLAFQRLHQQFGPL
ncbi:uncharacterized protein LOC130722175 [Lotus japonicus]|uniref:uncharacterized protein LOC130722175 n=1 Tax=Lotus japonicus TaxID=34305 RepID=UPI002587BFC8|nr:uncharacterized protein LOC130722175 [Lotus japonicus]